MQRAFLLGVASYRDPNIPDLDFIANDLDKVGASLEKRGFTVSRASSTAPTRNEVIAEVESFIASGRREETLVVYLSGHGAHSAGVDYLVPSDAVQHVHDLGDACVRVDKWAATISDTSAANVVFLVDACREGFDQATVMGAVGRRRAWSRGRIAVSAHRKWAFVFSCGSGQVSSYVSEDDGLSWSAFSKAFCSVLESDDCPGDVHGVKDLLQEKLNRILSEQRKPGQSVTVRSEHSSSSITLIPGLPHVPPDPAETSGGDSGAQDSGWVENAKKAGYTTLGFFLGALGNNSGNQ
ncbi:caspase family protein [Nocardiopsis deserti]|uniref:caspase family protein n=1 Tax=Nocardiopsis deserti TaxID=2605988 RepID=UPI0012398666|nr:caspase family protein [Nocardiopsis deserti]